MVCLSRVSLLGPPHYPAQRGQNKVVLFRRSEVREGSHVNRERRVPLREPSKPEMSQQDVENVLNHLALLVGIFFRSLAL